MEELFEQFNVFMKQNPHYGYLLGAVFLLVVSIGNFKKWNWAVSPSGYTQRFWYNILGEKYFSKIMGTIFLVGSMACFIGFYLANN